MSAAEATPPTGPEIAEKLAALWTARKFPSVTEITLTRGGQRADVYGIAQTYRLRVHIAEVKVSRSDLHGDIRRNKWTGYLDHCHALYFCVPQGLATKAEIPDPAGLIVYYPDTQTFRTAKQAGPTGALGSDIPGSGMLLRYAWRLGEQRRAEATKRQRAETIENARSYAYFKSVSEKVRDAAREAQATQQRQGPLLAMARRILGPDIQTMEQLLHALDSTVRDLGTARRLALGAELVNLAANYANGTLSYRHNEENERGLTDRLAALTEWQASGAPLPAANEFSGGPNWAQFYAEHRKQSGGDGQG